MLPVSGFENGVECGEEIRVPQQFYHGRTHGDTAMNDAIAVAALLT